MQNGDEALPKILTAEPTSPKINSGVTLTDTNFVKPFNRACIAFA